MQHSPLEGIVDLSRYPLQRPHSSAWRELVQTLHEQLDRNQFCTLPGFLLQEQCLEIAAAIELRMQKSNRADSERNVYLERSGDESLAADHPRNIFARGCYNMIGAHLLDADSPLKTLYYSTLMQEFTASIVGFERLYPSDDPYQPVNVLCHGPGDRSAWHFDSTSAFTMTLMLQAPEAGGHFEIAPNTRSETDPNLAGLTRLLQGNARPVVRVPRSAGELVIFRGCHSAHRVTPVEGKRRRQMCVMVYEDRPGVIGDPVVNATVYGVSEA